MNTKRRVAGVGLLVVVVAIVIVRNRKPDDVALTQALVGTWTAVDPEDGAIHRRALPVAQEQLVILADHTLTHIVELASSPGAPENDLWAWKVRKGRMYWRYRGDGAGGQWLPGVAFSVSDKALSLRLKGHLPKKWVRR